MFIPLLPEAIEAVELKEGIVEGDNHEIDDMINDKASGLYASIYSIGQMLGPMVGSSLYESIGYRDTSDFLAVMCIVYSIIYFIFNVGLSVLKDDKIIKEEIQILRESVMQKRSTQSGKKKRPIVF